jgi:NAD(P)-dependent dehydrogenase (short-subunit alcohol dehydrogenase family)
MTDQTRTIRGMEMPKATYRSSAAGGKAYIITGPTSGIGRRTALDVAAHGTVVLVGRDRGKLKALEQEIQQKGGNAACVVCDLSDITSVQRAAAEIVRLNLPLAGLVNNAGIMQMRPTKNGCGWDMSYATNHLGPFVLSEVLMPHLPDGANVVFVVSAVEDPERKPAVTAGFRGARYISAEACALGEWEPGGSTKPGFDAYATTKQAILAAAMAFARENPRLHINAIEPGFNPSTGLGAADANPFVRFVQRFVVPLIVPLLMPFIKILSTSKRAAREITKILIDTSGRTGVYYDERGQPMQGFYARARPEVPGSRRS